jgi:hypothetical protein
VSVFASVAVSWAALNLFIVVAASLTARRCRVPHARVIVWMKRRRPAPPREVGEG